MTCIHGQSVGNRVFCHHSAVAGRKKYVGVNPSQCTRCPYFTESPLGITLPILTECTYRTDQVDSIPANCGCAGIKTLDLHHCDLYGPCATDKTTHERLTETFRRNEDERRVKSCESCPHSWIPELNDTEIVFTYFNPCGWESRLDNFYVWWESLGQYRQIARGIHLAYDPREQTLPNCERIDAIGNQRYFVKEQLLNRLICTSTKKYVAWIDCDIVHDDRRWLQYAIKLLADWDAIQLFETLLQDGEPWHTCYGLGTGAPGGAWIARRELIQPMPIDQIVGGGDEEHVKTWAPGRIAPLPMKANHLRHGAKLDRKYNKRHDVLAGFDFSRDMRMADNGLYEIIDNALAERVLDYMLSRREDD